MVQTPTITEQLTDFFALEIICSAAILLTLPCWTMDHYFPERVSSKLSKQHTYHENNQRHHLLQPIDVSLKQSSFHENETQIILSLADLINISACNTDLYAC